MTTTKPMVWKRANKFINEPLVDYLERLFDETLDKGYHFDVAVGTDSQKSGKGYRFATVILIAMKENDGGVIRGRGGMLVHATYHEDMKAKGKEGVNHRMIYEVSKSIEVALQIADLIDLYGVKMSIHADINPSDKWESNKALRECTGYILGMGYDFKIKPCAHAASFGADRFCAS